MGAQCAGNRSYEIESHPAPISIGALNVFGSEECYHDGSALQVWNPNLDAGLLLLRIGTGINLFLKHGLEKVLYFPITAPRFSDVIGIGHIPTLMIAFTSDVICSLLIVFGAATRWCTIFYLGVLLIAWDLWHQFLYWGLPPGVPGDHLKGDHGELIVCYLVVMIVLFVTGAGRYSVDAWLARSGNKA